MNSYILSTIFAVLTLVQFPLTYDVTLPNYFRKNQYIQNVFNLIGFLQQSYFTVLENILDLNGMQLNTKASVFPLLDSLRNSFMGKL